MGLEIKAKSHSLLLLMLGATTCWCQRSPFSLQAAVDELHRQEYPLNAPPAQQPYFLPGALGSSPDQDYWDEDAAYTYNLKKPRTRLNKQLAKYLERENYIADHGGLQLGPFGGYEFDEDSNKLVIPQYREDRKRASSVFRERNNNLYDDIPASLFREREIQNNVDTNELADQFLHEIEKAQEHERQDRYKEALRSLWQKYQQQENQIEGDIFEEQQKRMRMPPYYMLMQKKRSYPVLPWLPYNAERKKRFPVAKRSANHIRNDSPLLTNLEKTDENVERELSELFGSGSGTGADEKKKRSVGASSHSKPATTHAPAAQTPTTTNMRLEMDVHSHKNKTTEEPEDENAVKRSPVTSPPEGVHHQHSGHNLKEHKHGKRSNHAAAHDSHEDEGEEEEEEEDSAGEHDSEEEEEEDDEEEHHDAEHGHEHGEHDDDAQEEARRKKKRSASAAKKKRNAVTWRHNIDDFNVMRSKKSFDWSNYFGLDRKKKAMSLVNNNNNKDDELVKRNANEDPSAEELNQKKKRKLDPAKLDNMNKKLQAIEDFIINETIKYTGAHEGVDNPEEIQRLKDHVLSRLATAYSLEKMRRALEKLRQSVDNDNHLMRNIIDTDNDSSLEINPLEAVKKDKSTDVNSSDNDEAAAMKKKMKKSNGYSRYPDVENEFGEMEAALQSPNRYETLNDAYLGNKNYILGTNQCPIIEAMAERCRGVDLLSGDVNQELLPLCGVHQLCYLCGTSQIACDYQYLSEADAVCGHNNNECQAAARSVLMILRGTPGPQLGPRECLKNSCLYSAMREIGL